MSLRSSLDERQVGGRYFRWRLGAERSCLVDDVVQVAGLACELFVDARTDDVNSESRVTEAALAAVRDGDVSDLRTEPTLGTCLAFHTGGLPQSHQSDALTRLREVVDRRVGDLLTQLDVFPGGFEHVVSGHFWYPASSSMGWHTNSRVPGWRAYLTHAAAPDRSFFRYLDPDVDRVVTSWDSEWDLRVFQVSAEEPFWHCVWADVDRFSFGYKVTPMRVDEHPML